MSRHTTTRNLAALGTQRDDGRLRLRGGARATGGAATPSTLASNGRGRAHPPGDYQRTRIRAAMVEVACEQGFAAATIARIVERAGLSRRTFYELFDNRTDCLLECFDDAIARASPSVLTAYASQATWADRVRAGLGAILMFMDEEPQLARLCVVEMLEAGPKALAHRHQLLDRFSAAVDEGRGPRREGSTSLIAEATVAVVVAMIHSRVLEPTPEPLLAMLSQLMSMIVLPFQDPKRAHGELERRAPRPRPPRRRRPWVSNMRLTYRTVRTLRAIRAAPGASNCELASAAGIADPGQISRLLARLSRLGLVRNERHLSAHGRPNAWWLTDDGRQLLEAVVQEAQDLQPRW